MNYNWRFVKLFHSLIYILAFSNAMAVNIDYNFEFKLARHENINLILNPVEEEWVETLGATMNIVENSSSFLTNVNANVTAINYRNNQQQDAIFNNLNLNSTWIISPRHFEWVLLDVYTQTILDPLQSNTQSNRQNTNIFTTGPKYYWRLNSRNNINFSARLQNTSYDSTNDDSNRVSTELNWLYNINSSLVASINAENEVLSYLDDTQDGYNNTSLFARLEYKKARNTYIAETGLTNINYDSRSEFLEERYLLSFQNQRTTNSDVVISYSHNISDAATEISSAAQNITTNNTLLTTVSGTDVFTEDNFTFQYNRTFNSSALNVVAENINRNYITQNTLDTKIQRLSILPTYNFNRTSSIELEVTRTKTTYTNFAPAREDTDNLYRATYNNSIGRNINGALSFEFVERISTNALLSYEDKRVIATLNYIIR